MGLKNKNSGYGSELQLNDNLGHITCGTHFSSKMHNGQKYKNCPNHINHKY